MLIYLDANIFLTYLNREKNSYSEATNEIFKDFESGKHKIVTSLITLIEVLPHDTKNYDDFERMIKRIELFPMNRRVVRLAAELRNAFYAQPQPGGGALKIPDTIHVASAVAAKVEYLLTGDGPMINLAPAWVKNIVGQDIQIIKPPIPRSQPWLS